MPIEVAADQTPKAIDESLAAAYLAETRLTLAHALTKIRHCLDQLTDEDLWWRADESHNSVQNMILHLCGNVRQWILHGVGGVPDRRDRPREFSDRRPIPKAELLEMLSEVVGEADRVLADCPPARLLETRRIQGFTCSALSAIFDSVSHFVGHTHQIVYITRLRIGGAYRFQWVPDGVSQSGTA